MQASLIDFVLTYFSWWPSFALSILTLLTLHISRFYHQKETSSAMVIMIASNVLVQVMALSILHLTFKQVAILYEKQAKHL